MKLQTYLFGFILLFGLTVFAQDALPPLPADKDKIEMTDGQQLDANAPNPFEKTTTKSDSSDTQTTTVADDLEAVENGAKNIFERFTQKIDTIEQFDGLVSTILGLLIFLLTNLGRFFPKILLIKDNERRAIAIGLAALLGFTFLKGDLNGVIFLQWLVSFGGITVFYQIISKVLPFLKTPKIDSPQA